MDDNLPKPTSASEPLKLEVPLEEPPLQPPVPEPESVQVAPVPLPSISVTPTPSPLPPPATVTAPPATVPRVVAAAPEPLPAPNPAAVNFAEDPTTRPPKPVAAASDAVTPPHSGKPKPLFAAIIALLLLIAALGGGLYLVGQQGVGEIRRAAACPSAGTCTYFSCDQKLVYTGRGPENNCERTQESGFCQNNYPASNPCGVLEAVCGDGVCAGENEINSCPQDCGAPAATATTSAGGGSSYDCRYENNGTTVSVTGGDCGQYIFRALLYQCDGRNEGDYDRCQPGTPGYGETLRDEHGATSVSIGSPTCQKRQQADLIVVDRPNDGLDDNELPGTPRIANYIIKVNSDSCSSPTTAPTPTPVSTATPTEVQVVAQCMNVTAQTKDATGNWVNVPGNNLPSRAKAGDRVRFVAQGSTNSGSFTQGAFFINGTLNTEDVTKIDATHFAVEYTIPASGGNLKVEAVLLHNSKGWVD